MKLAVVVQRYGADLNGGAELHARYIAERLSRHADVEVLTTCARDYITWKNEFSPGEDEVNGVRVRRFRVKRTRDPDEFGRRSERVFHQIHSIRDELAWLHSEGPTSPALITFLGVHATDYDFVIFFSYRYHHAYHGIRRVPERALLVPTAERDAALGLSIFGPTFRGVRAIMYNSHEERALIEGVARTERVPGVVVGVGSEIPSRASARRFRQRYDLRRRFALYVGRIDENKGCGELFDCFRGYMSARGRLDLALIGNPVMTIPSDRRIRHLGFVSEEDKYDALAAADVLIMPSYFESLSMVTLEAWAMGIPVLVNGRCDVLRGQVVRSNAGLYYENAAEFHGALSALEANEPLRRAMGRHGRAYFRSNYTWPIIERKYLNMLSRLARDGTPDADRLEPLPRWWAARRRELPPAAEIVDRLPTGPARDRRSRRHG